MSQHEDDDDEGLPHQEKKGETWLMTFADMMSLLMSFFVLMLSFSEQDAAKFKQVGGSLERAFGVQTEVPVFDVVKGTSLIADRFSAGKPDPTDQNEVKQSTSASLAKNLEVNKRLKTDDKNLTLEPEKLKFKPSHGDKETGASQKEKFERAKAKEMVGELNKVLASEISQHKIEIERNKNSVTIRILEKAYFNSGDDSLKPSFVPFLKKLSPLLAHFPGKIIVSGHTDNLPISNARFRSNWDLSAARAATTLHYLNEVSQVDASKMMITGYADTKPLIDNDSDEGRSRNRRVEITLLQGSNPLFDDDKEDHEHESQESPTSTLEQESKQTQPVMKKGLWGVPYLGTPQPSPVPLKEEGPLTISS